MVMKDRTLKDFFTRGADEQLDHKIQNLAASQDLTEDLVHCKDKSSTFTVCVARFVKRVSREVNGKGGKVYERHVWGNTSQGGSNGKAHADWRLSKFLNDF